jgi:hypothetical protein
MSIKDYPDLQIIKEDESDLRIKLAKYEQILIENDLLELVNKISDAEAICIREIQKLNQLSATSGLTIEDAKVFDILHKNLVLARERAGTRKKGKKEKEVSVAELLSIVKDKPANG